jgi:hypothetical protein
MGQSKRKKQHDEVPWGRERTRAALGLAVWEIELAVATGLLVRREDRRFEADEVRAALGDVGTFRARLAAEHRLNATQAAARLGISRHRFARLVAQAGLAPVGEEQLRRYGRTLTVRYYRAADVDELTPRVAADRARRSVRSRCERMRALVHVVSELAARAAAEAAVAVAVAAHRGGHEGGVRAPDG